MVQFVGRTVDEYPRGGTTPLESTVLNVVLVTTDAALAALVRGFADQSIEFTVERLIDSHPTGFEISRALATSFPDVVAIEIRDPNYDPLYAAAVHKAAPEMPIVALTGRDGANVALRFPESGILETLVWPFTVVELEDALERAVLRSRKVPHDNLFAFLPGKAGSGASTVIYQSAGALAAALDKRPLVIEGDLHSGLLASVLNRKAHSNVREALSNAKHMTVADWHNYLANAGGVDFALADPAVKVPVPAWSHYYQLFRFVLPKYDAVLVDLPEVVNSATAEAVRTARAVYVVCTPELPSLTLARQRCNELAGWGVESARIFGILNRWHRRDMSARDAEDILGHPVAAVLPNDYRSIQHSLAESRPVDRNSELGEAYYGFARTLAGMEAAPAAKQSFFARLRAS